ncbi:hypothetical protein [Lysobacter silvisoli]|uniref:Ricin B lectin domain-containing protein n=1 Tax=Lysobacter silvisoli TaxID=2293254 RepID=A0A371JWG2_9GAMM|nr:hypothetical protein [Lysobacter silvisoli]RDZ25970.1 hypothetical protein DX914_19080 [Lysobacter silvisoli]
MDAYGNLTSVEEFFNNRVRFVSYLDPDVAMGYFPPDADTNGAHCARVHRLSAGNPNQTVWTSSPASPESFSLSPDWAQYLTWQCGAGGVLLTQPMADPGDGSLVFAPAFKVDFLQGDCWFALNDFDRDQVVDISESGTAEGNAIIAFPWNGGANQIWRAQAV